MLSHKYLTSELGAQHVRELGSMKDNEDEPKATICEQQKSYCYYFALMYGVALHALKSLPKGNKIMWTVIWWVHSSPSTPLYFQVFQTK